MATTCVFCDALDTHSHLCGKIERLTLNLRAKELQVSEGNKLIDAAREAWEEERQRMNLQIGELKKALYAECTGQACNSEDCYQGYRECTGCEIRAKKAYGEGWGK